jgi:PEGA domain
MSRAVPLAARLLDRILELFMRYPFFATFNSTSTSAIAALVLVLALPNTSAAQARNRDGGDSTGRSQAVPRNPAPAPAPAAAPAPAPAPAPAAAPANQSGQAVVRTAPRTVERAGSSSPAEQNQGARPRQGRPTVGTAVPRGSVPPPRVNVVTPSIRYYRGYSPWGFGGVGFGSYYGSFYDPYVFYDPFSPWYGGYGSYGLYGAYGYPSYGYGSYGSYGYPSAYSTIADGSLRLKIKPRDAQVFVDGYYVGIVDDFDGVFQRMHLPSGPHRVEVRAPGYETLTFDVQIRFDETTKFEGELQRIR